MLMMWVWLAVSVTLCSAAADPNNFKVWGPDQPVLSSPGASVILPCTFSPVLSTEELEVRWYRPGGLNTPILLYNDLKIQESPADPQYRDRVSLIGSLEEGNVSLKLENLRQSDRGEYMCYVNNGKWYETARVSLTMKALGSEPVVSVTETGGEQVNVTCVSDGWSPQPTVTWRDREGRELRSTDSFSTNSDELVSVSSWLLFSPSESEWISCSVSLSDQEKTEGRVLPRKFPKDHSGPWRGAFIITLILLLLVFIALAVLFLHKKGLILQKKSKRNPEAADSSESGGNETGEEHDVLLENHTEKKFQIPDWMDVKKEIKEDLTFKDKLVPQCLTVTDKKKKLAFTGSDSTTENRKTVQVPHALCEQTFSSGKHYWEVKLCDENEAPKRAWMVGVIRDGVGIKQGVPLFPQNGCWALHYEEGSGLYVYPDANTKVVVAKKCGSKLGVFVDCDQSTVSFYDTDAESHLYTFINVIYQFSLGSVMSPGVKDPYPLTLG